MRAFLIALVLLTAPSGAWGQWSGDPDPPERYVRPYTGKLIVTRTADHDELWAVCRWLFEQHYTQWLNVMHPPGELNGCAIPMNSPLGERFSACHVVLVRGDDNALEHERAHCNGWPAHHPVDLTQQALER